MKWMEYVLSSLGQSAPSHRYLNQREPEGGRIFIIEYANIEDERKFDKMRLEDEMFAKFRDEWMSGRSKWRWSMFKPLLTFRRPSVTSGGEELLVSRWWLMPVHSRF